MSLLKPVININPAYATNTLNNGQAGWYQVSPTTSNLALRVSNSTIGMTGEIKLNTSTNPYKFQGYNGSGWVDFNAIQGERGVPGRDFTNVVNFNNLGADTTPGVQVTRGQIFATTSIDGSEETNDVNIRTIASGVDQINSNLSINTMLITQNSNVITLTGQPLPYEWNFSSSNSAVTYLKNANNDTTNYGWGDVSTWTVKPGSTVTKGYAVRLDNYNNSNIVIVPLTYTSLTNVTPYNTPINMLGIALETAVGGASCRVCTKGLTTVFCGNNINNFSSKPSGIGLDGLVDKDGAIFCNVSPPSVNYFIRAGYFLETGITSSSYSLFFVEPRVERS
jgi:hypothetical protein